jgi:hypothetical protein
MDACLKTQNMRIPHVAVAGVPWIVYQYHAKLGLTHLINVVDTNVIHLHLTWSGGAEMRFSSVTRQ